LTYPNPDGRGRLPLSTSIRNHLLNVMHYKRYCVNCHGRVMTDADWGAYSASALEAFRFWEDLLVSEHFIISDKPDGKMTEKLGIQPVATIIVADESSTASAYGIVHNGADIHPVYMAKQTDHSDDDLPADDVCPWTPSYRTTYDARQQTSDLRTGDDNWHMDLHAQTEFFLNEDGLLDDAGPWDPGYALGVPGDPPDDITMLILLQFSASPPSCRLLTIWLLPLHQGNVLVIGIKFATYLAVTLLLLMRFLAQVGSPSMMQRRPYPWDNSMR
jgi:hypothetical protein